MIGGMNAIIDTSSRLPEEQASVSQELRIAAVQALRAAQSTFEFIRLQALASRDRAGKLTVQVAASAAFALALFVWLEVTLYLALASAMAAPWAALLLLVFNGGAVVTLNLFFTRWRKVSEPVSLAAHKREEAVVELRSARDELVLAKERMLDRADTVVKTRLIARYERYRAPAAVVMAFATGLLIARALIRTQSRP